MWLDLASSSIASATQNVPLAKRERALARVFLIVLLFFWRQRNVTVVGKGRTEASEKQLVLLCSS